MYRVPAMVEEMTKRGWLGDKTGQGFYNKVRGESEREILTLDVNTLEKGRRATRPSSSSGADSPRCASMPHGGSRKSPTIF